MSGYVRQAVVVVHGMGEQLPLDTLCGFINTALAPDEHGRRRYYSRPESVTVISTVPFSTVLSSATVPSSSLNLMAFDTRFMRI